MTRQQLERHQVWFYMLAILAGLAAGRWVPEAAPLLESSLWPALALLLYATFTQVPLMRLRVAFRDRRFLTTMMAGNFVFMPLLVWALLALAPADPSIRLGILLVLLVPCTDWFVAFAHLGGGDPARATASTPLLLVAQIALLPLYLWLFLGEAFSDVLAVERIGAVFVGLIAMPLLAAIATERWAERRPERAPLVESLGILPVPLLALVVFLVAGSQGEAIGNAMQTIDLVLGIFVLYLVAAVAVGTILGRTAGLAPASTRTLIFSLATRNSFVVLPFALALPAVWQAAAVVIVLQSLVELFGMLACLWAVPRLVVGRDGLGIGRD